MPINEAQLTTWSSQGSVQQSAATYQTIKNVLNDTKSPYYAKWFSNFLQGSYGNDTNVWRDSDVDIVMRLTSVYYSDTSSLNADEKANFDRGWSAAEYSFDQFKREVAAWLIANYGVGVDASGKAIFVPGSGNRRNADVLACAEHRLYLSYPSVGEPTYMEGIVFWNADGTKIVNYPKQHSENCTIKHQNTKSWFKPTVRVFKNIRNRMIDDGLLKEGVAPSYFLEGMLWNVPDNLFGKSYFETVVACFNHMSFMEDKTQLKCANNYHWLLRDEFPTSWSLNDHSTFMEAFKLFWNNY